MFNSIIGGSLNVATFIVCIVTAIILGFVVGILHKKTCKSNSNFVSTLVILPVLVTVVILLVNGNLGTSVAVLGAFSLIRFRSIPGNSKEILDVFFTMAIGLAVGTGYIAFAVIFTLVTSILSYGLYKLNFGEDDSNDRILRIFVPEDLNYSEVFNDIFDDYLNKYEIFKVKTVNMGSIFEISYLVSFKNSIKEKEFIDKIRVRNGNLKIVLFKDSVSEDSL